MAEREYDLVDEWQDWNSRRSGDVYLGDAASMHCLRKLIEEKIGLAVAEHANRVGEEVFAPLQHNGDCMCGPHRPFCDLIMCPRQPKTQKPPGSP